MTTTELKQKACKLYRELWGDDWISEHEAGIYDTTSLHPDENGDFYFSLLQSDAVADCEPFATEEEAIEYLSNLPPEKPADHCTRFLCNIKTGEVKVIEHY
jgi:hypothetical protein